MAETLLFYHPAIWWLSGVIRQERENCCDDMAIQVCEGDKVTYAKTLARLKTLRPPTQLAMAASGGSLLKRIQRLADKPSEVSNPVQWLVVTCLALFPWFILSVATAQASFPKVIEDNIDVFVETQLKDWDLPGLQMIVVKDGEMAFNKAFGLADVENNIPMTVDTLMPIGGLSRAFTIIAVMQLVEEDKLKLDGTLAEYLPWVELPDYAQNEITLEQLIKLKGARAYGSGEELRCPSECSELVTPDIITKEAYIRSLMPENLKLTGYSNMISQAQHSAIILGLIIEKITGMKFEEYMQTNVFAPLQINATYDIQWARQNGLAMGYSQMPGSPTKPIAYSFP